MGDTTIRAYFASGELEDTGHVTITPASLEKIVVTPPKTVRNKEADQQYIATGIYSDLTTIPLANEDIDWISTNTSVASIDDKGMAHTLNLGETTIRATSAGVSGETLLTVVASQLQHLRIEPGEITNLPAGKTQQLKAWGIFVENGITTEAELTDASIWHSNSPTDISVSNADDRKGVVTALREEGCATIYAKYEEVEAEATVCAGAAELLSLEIRPQNTAITTHSYLLYEAWGRYSNDTDAQNISDHVTWWISDNTAVATMNGREACGVTEGSANIIAIHQGKTAISPLLVTGNPITQMWIVTTGDFVVGTQKQLKAFAQYSNGDTRDVTEEVHWVSEDMGKLSVDDSGMSDALAAGQAGVTISHPDYDDASLGTVNTNVEISAASLVEILVVPAYAELPKGAKQQYSAIGKYDNCTEKELTDQVDWSSSNTQQASINDSGMLTAKDEGTPTISARLGSVVGETNVTITKAVIKSLILTPHEETIKVGSKLPLEALAIMTDDRIVNVTSNCQWVNNSLNTLGLTDIDADKKQIEGLTQGIGNIGISYLDENENLWADSSDYTVLQGPIVPIDIRIEPENISLALGLSQTYLAIAIFPDHEEEICEPVQWESSDEGVASIDASGEVQTHKTGTTTISAVCQGMEGTTELTVTAAVLVDIEVNPVDFKMDKSRSHQFECWAIYTNRREEITISQVRDLTWTSSKTNIAWVLNSHLVPSGKVHSLTVGGHTQIKCVYESEGRTYSDEVTLTVLD
ncbi:MAG: Ig-like domain-containing protein [Pseudomonadales bacterium]|nr:Ig-like domain-containing protein [Pseudomonadales bacterium]